MSTSLIGNDLGLMKDELKGNVIKEAYFFCIKQYGYYYYDKNNDNKKITKSVFQGVKKDSLTFNEIKDIYNNKTIEKYIENRFYKSLNTLNITIKSTKLSIKKNNDKKLVNNSYIPKHINDLNHNLDNRTFINKIKNNYL